MKLTLSLKDRIILANQYLILEKLYENDAKLYAHLRESLERGYALDYNEIAEHFWEEMSVDQCREVQDILEMYRSIRDSYQSLKDQTGIDINAITFRGFDGNEETRYHEYARFLIEDQGRWSESNTGDLNRPSPALPKYRRMLERWKSSRDTFRLTKEELQHILAL